MRTRVLGVAALTAFALSQAASAHARHHDPVPIYRGYQAVSPSASRCPV